MTRDEIKEVLEKQLQLLSEHSKNPYPSEDIAEISRAALEIAEKLLTLCTI